MTKRHRSPRSEIGAASAPAPLDPKSAYGQTMQFIQLRLKSVETRPVGVSDFQWLEHLALQVRKIVEGVAFAALSAAEHYSKQILKDQRTKDADKLLSWLAAKSMLRLPKSQDWSGPDPVAKVAGVISGRGDRDMTLEMLKAAYSRSSTVIHERHPERRNRDTTTAQLIGLTSDARGLKDWLWNHVMFFEGTGFLLRLDQPAASSQFMLDLAKIAELPEGYPGAGAP